MLRGRRSRYEEFWALKGVSFEIPQGSTFGIIGSNGSGKSTLLKCLAGILVPDRGSLTTSGRISALLELGAGFHPELSGRENVYLNGAILGMTNKDIVARFDDIIEFSGLGSFIDNPVRSYSSGMVVRLGFAIAASVDPEILLIDEVLAVGDASFQQRCYEKIEEFRKDGRTIVLVSHGLSQVEQLCNTVAWLDKGLLRHIGPAMNVITEYTGVSHNAQPRSEGEIGERWGSGEVEILKIELLGRDRVNNTFNTNRPLTIRVFFDAHQPITDAVVGIRISHLHGMPVWGTNSRRRGISLPRLFGRGYVDVVIEQFPLLEGTYDLTVAIANYGEVHTYDHWEKRVRFDVHQQDVFDEGLVSLKANWDLSGAISSN